MDLPRTRYAHAPSQGKSLETETNESITVSAVSAVLLLGWPWY